MSLSTPSGTCSATSRISTKPPPVKKAIRDQLDELPYYSTFRGTTNSPLIELSYELAEWFKPDGLSRSFFTSGGSDSVETCLRRGGEAR